MKTAVLLDLCIATKFAKLPN